MTTGKLGCMVINLTILYNKVTYENIGWTLHGIETCKEFLGSDPENAGNKNKMGKWNFIKSKSFYIGKETINKGTTYRIEGLSDLSPLPLPFSLSHPDFQIND